MTRPTQPGISWAGDDWLPRAPGTNPLLRSAAASAPVTLLRDFVRMHGEASLQGPNEALLLRTFVLADYVCPAHYGDLTGRFLDSFAFAVETNRTLLWQPWLQRGITCDSVQRRRSWMPGAEAVVPKLARAWLLHEQTSSSSRAAVMGAIENRSWAIALSAMGRLAEHDCGFGNGSPTASHAVIAGLDVERRQRQLYYNGVPAARGALFETAFVVAQTIPYEAVNPSFHSVTGLESEVVPAEHSRRVVLGVHMRHYDKSLSGRRSGVIVSKSLRQVLNRLSAHIQTDGCTVLVASDRPGGFEPVQEAVFPFGCTVIRTNSNKTAAQRKVAWSHEHGPWGEEPRVVGDMAMLSLATSAFIVHTSGRGAATSGVGDMVLAHDQPDAQCRVKASFKSLDVEQVSSFAARAYERAAFRSLTVKGAPLPLYVCSYSKTNSSGTPACCAWLPRQPLQLLPCPKRVHTAKPSAKPFAQMHATWLEQCQPQRSPTCQAWSAAVDAHVRGVQKTLAAAREMLTGAAIRARFNPQSGPLDIFNATWTCASAEYLPQGGNLKEGGKYMCGIDLLSARARPADCLIYSFGSEGRPQWEKAMHARLPRCKIFTFDPTMPATGRHGVDSMRRLETQGVLTFTELGLVGGEDVMWGDPKAFTIDPNKTRHHGVWGTSYQKVQQYLGHAGREPEVLKIDVEGSEIDVFQAPTCLRAGQMQMEVHTNRLHESRLPDALQLFENLARCGYAIFAKERMTGEVQEFAFVSPRVAFGVWLAAFKHF